MRTTMVVGCAGSDNWRTARILHSWDPHFGSVYIAFGSAGDFHAWEPLFTSRFMFFFGIVYIAFFGWASDFLAWEPLFTSVIWVYFRTCRMLTSETSQMLQGSVPCHRRLSDNTPLLVVELTCAVLAVKVNLLRWTILLPIFISSVSHCLHVALVTAHHLLHDDALQEWYFL